MSTARWKELKPPFGGAERAWKPQDRNYGNEHTEEEMIKIENIQGKLFLIGADDDSF